MILYDYYRSSACYRVRIALNLKQLSYQKIPVNLLKTEQRSSNHLSRNPQGLIPVLEHNGVKLSQSLAICEYLDEEFPIPAPLLPQNPGERQRVRSLAQLIACEIHPLNNLRSLKYLQAEYEISDEQKTQWYQYWIKEGFDALELRLSQETATGRFCHGDEPGLADLCLMPQLYNARRFDCPLGKYPTILKIETACQQLKAFKDAYPST